MTSTMDPALLQSLQVACDGWQALAWSQTLSGIFETVSATKESSKAALQTRKLLSETTKSFRKSLKGLEQAAAEASPELVAKAVESLAKEAKVTIKSYQEEIDVMTKRCKASEAAYGILGQSLTELADPAAALKTCLDHLQTQQSQFSSLLQTVERLQAELQTQQGAVQDYKNQVETLKHGAAAASSSAGPAMSRQERDELIQLRREVAEYEVEFRSLKNQDITIRKLEGKIAEMQTVGEATMKDQLTKAKEDLEATEGRRAAEALEREAAMERQVHSLELQLKAERAGREATQEHLLESDEGLHEREAAWEAQRRILVDDSERLREALQVMTRERDEFRLKAAAVVRTGPTPPPSGGISFKDLILERSAYEAEVSELSETVALLRQELRSKDDVALDEKRAFQARIDTLEREKDSLKTNLSSLETQVSSAPSQALVESMKRELRILKRLEYNADDVDADRDPEIAGGLEDEKDLESVLVAKLRRAESELVTERNMKGDLSRECDSLRNALDDANKAKTEAEQLVASLERDLERAIATPSASASRKTTAHAVEADPAALQSILDPSAPPPPPKGTALTTKSAKETEKDQDDHSVATIVMAQRDRLRARCEALEAERDSFKRELQGQVQASESLKADNTKLYEKVRYLQNYKPPSSRGGGFRGGNDRDLDLEALEQRYEASVDPFRQFSKAERQRKLAEMSPMERAVFVVAKTTLATREMRTALFVYVVALHLLVFYATYHLSHTGGCHNVDNDHLSHLPPHMQEHMADQIAADAAGT